jgi:AcrR family transcriptional regulator
MDSANSTHQGGGPVGRRRYQSPLRQRQASRTRELILAAYADLVVAQGTSAVTMAAVADRAGVAERTVYRHFPNARALLDGLSEEAGAVMREHGADQLVQAGLSDAVDRAAVLYQGFEAAGAPMKAAVIAGLSGDYRSPGQGSRVSHIHDAVRRELPNLSEAELHEAVVMIRFQLGAWAWYLLTEREGLTTGQAARLSARAVRAFVADLKGHSDTRGSGSGA